MRSLGDRGTLTTVRVVGALVALTVMLAGCGGGADSDPPQGKGDSSSSATSASPSEEATPSVLEGGTTVEGPAFTFTVAPGYELANSDDGGGSLGKWLRSYSERLSNFTVGYLSSESLPLNMQLDAVRLYLTSRGMTQIERAEDLTVVGHDAAHFIGRDGNAEIHGYMVELDRHYLEIFVERRTGGDEQKRIQRAMIKSLRLTE